jgi:hypothetical protein
MLLKTEQFMPPLKRATKIIQRHIPEDAITPKKERNDDPPQRSSAFSKCTYQSCKRSKTTQKKTHDSDLSHKPHAELFWARCLRMTCVTFETKDANFNGQVRKKPPPENDETVTVRFIMLQT